MFELTDQGQAVRGRAAPEGFNVIFRDLELCVTTEPLALKTATEAAIWLLVCTFLELIVLASFGSCFFFFLSELCEAVRTEPKITLDGG